MGRRSGQGSSLVVSGVEQERPRIPAWFGEAVLLGKYWIESGLVARLEEEVRVVRGRMGQYEVVDFVLLLNAYAMSGEKSLAAFFKALAPVKEVLMGVWGRSRCPSASSLSRFLAAVGEASLSGLRRMFEWDLERNGIRVREGIGLFDRSQQHSVVFDVDGTVCAVRQRWIEDDAENYPPGRRRSEASCASGYRGRKRGEVIRNRTTVAIAQTSEWLGTYGGAGNGEAKRELKHSCSVMKRYLAQQGLHEAHGLVRLDGLYGTPSLLSVVQEAGLGYIVRGRDYTLLKHPTLQKRMDAAVGTWERLGNSSNREVFDGGYIEDGGRGYVTPMRVIVMRTPVKLHEGRVGKRVKEYVYELFLTSYSVVNLSAVDVIGVYRGRGGFEQRLSEEDEEQDADRWCSWQPEGQEFWQILAQWVWNWRVWMGWQQRESQEIRQTIWAEGIECRVQGSLQESELTPALLALKAPVSQGAVAEEASEPERQMQYGPMMVSTERGRGGKQGNRFGNEDFQIVDKETVLCPAGHPMYCRMQQVRSNGDLARQFSLRASTCQRCPVKRRCLAPKSKGKAGRRVTVVQRAEQGIEGRLATTSALVRSVMSWFVQGQPHYEQPILWCDVEATQLRRKWSRELACQEIGIEEQSEGTPPQVAKSAQLLTRHQRAHHRLSWWERIKRNARKVDEKTWNIVLYGNGGKLLEAVQALTRPREVAAKIKR